MTIGIEVELHAFESGGVVRVVDVPEDEWRKAPDFEGELGLVFMYGQNDFQNKPIRSVSVGDVVRMPNGKRWKVEPCGWSEVRA